MADRRRSMGRNPAERQSQVWLDASPAAGRVLLAWSGRSLSQPETSSCEGVLTCSYFVHIVPISADREATRRFDASPSGWRSIFDIVDKTKAATLRIGGGALPAWARRQADVSASAFAERGSLRTAILRWAWGPSLEMRIL